MTLQHRNWKQTKKKAQRLYIFLFNAIVFKLPLFLHQKQVQSSHDLKINMNNVNISILNYDYENYHEIKGVFSDL